MKVELVQLFKRLHAAQSYSSDSNLAIIGTYYSCQHINCIMECRWGRLPTPNFAPYLKHNLQQHNF